MSEVVKEHIKSHSEGSEYKSELIEALCAVLREIQEQLNSEKIKIGKAGHAYVIDEEGYLIAYPDIGRVLKREKLNYLNEVSAFIDSSKDEYEREANISEGIEKRFFTREEN